MAVVCVAAGLRNPIILIVTTTIHQGGLHVVCTRWGHLEFQNRGVANKTERAAELCNSNDRAERPRCERACNNFDQ